MGRWDAVSDFDYYEEMNPQRREPRCQRCGREMVIVYNGDGNPVWARCDTCSPLPKVDMARRTA